MYEKFVEGKTLTEKEEILNFDEVTKENIIKSVLSDFSKNFILYDFKEDLNKDELISRVEKSNKLYFNYAIRPKWTLLNFLFSNFESRPPTEIIKKLNVFPFYKFYADSISDFIKENFQIFITKKEITSIIDETNKVIYEKLTNDISGLKIKNFFLYLFKLKYSDESEINLESTLPYSFIKIFLNDKSYFSLDKKFEAIRDIKDESEISLKDIIKILNDKYTFTEISKIEDDVFNEPEKNDTEVIEVISAETKIKKDIKKDELKKNEFKKESESENKIKNKEEDRDNLIYSKQLSDEAIEKKQIEDDFIDDNVKQDNDSLNSLFDERLLKKISDKVFGSDEVYKESCFKKLNSCHTWAEASAQLMEIFQINKVNIYNKDVVKFVNILNEYFQNKE